MGQSHIRGLKPETALSSEDVTRMVCVLIRKYGDKAPGVARLLADEHRCAGDIHRARAWNAVAARVELLIRRGWPAAPARPKLH